MRQQAGRGVVTCRGMSVQSGGPSPGTHRELPFVASPSKPDCSGHPKAHERRRDPTGQTSIGVNSRYGRASGGPVRLGAPPGALMERERGAGCRGPAEHLDPSWNWKPFGRPGLPGIRVTQRAGVHRETPQACLRPAEHSPSTTELASTRIAQSAGAHPDACACCGYGCRSAVSPTRLWWSFVSSAAERPGRGRRRSGGIPLSAGG